MRPRRRTLVRALLLILLLGAWPLSRAGAAGLSVFNHGVRPMGRGGAFVAGGDDPGGIWYNPASIGGLAGLQVLADGTLIFYQSEYTRVDSGGNRLPSVSSEGPIIPIPTLAASLAVWRDRLFVGAAVTAPNSVTLKYPMPSYAPCASDAPAHCIDTAHADSPQRYSLVSQEGTRLVQLDLTFTARLWDKLYLGFSLQNMFVDFATVSAISSYNGALSSGPEDPDFDSLTQLQLRTYFNPSAKIGLIWSPHPQVRLGVAYQLPFWIRGDAGVNVQLPVSPLYQRATVEGDRAKVSLDLPMSVRAGCEWAPFPWLRFELDFEWEQWSATRAITVEPQDIYILNLPSIDRFKVSALENVLHFQDSYAIRLGGEYQVGRLPLVLRAGYVFERGAVQQHFASALSLDSDKHVVTAGASYTVWGFRIDVGVARSFSATRVVNFTESEIRQVNPINPTGAATVGGGLYHADFTLVGAGLHRVF